MLNMTCLWLKNAFHCFCLTWNPAISALGDSCLPQFHCYNLPPWLNPLPVFEGTCLSLFLRRFGVTCFTFIAWCVCQQLDLFFVTFCRASRKNACEVKCTFYCIKRRLRGNLWKLVLPASRADSIQESHFFIKKSPFAAKNRVLEPRLPTFNVSLDMKSKKKITAFSRADESHSDK